MMDLLRATAREVVPALIDRIEERVDPARLRGLLVDVDPYWLAWFEHYWFTNSPPGSYYWNAARRPSWLLNEPPPDWNRHCHRQGYPSGASPVRFRVVFRQRRDLDEVPELPTSVGAYPILYEARPPARGLTTALTASDNVGESATPTQGTLGGFLRNSQTHTDYAVSCAHVLGQQGETVYTPGPAAKNKQHTAAGNVAYALVPAPNTQAGCNLRSHPTFISVDVAVATLDPSVQPHPAIPSLGKPQSVTSYAQMKTGDAVSLYGQKSHLVHGELGQLGHFYAIDIDGHERCFGDIFTMLRPKPRYLSTPLVQEGDSGAWIVRTVNGLLSWDGMLFAGDADLAFGCFAENLLDVLDRHFATLTLPP